MRTPRLAGSRSKYHLCSLATVKMYSKETDFFPEYLLYLTGHV